MVVAWAAAVVSFCDDEERDYDDFLGGEDIVKLLLVGLNAYSTITMSNYNCIEKKCQVSTRTISTMSPLMSATKEKLPELSFQSDTTAFAFK